MNEISLVLQFGSFLALLKIAVDFGHFKGQTNSKIENLERRVDKLEDRGELNWNS